MCEFPDNRSGNALTGRMIPDVPDLFTLRSEMRSPSVTSPTPGLRFPLPNCHSHSGLRSGPFSCPDSADGSSLTTGTYTHIYSSSTVKIPSPELRYYDCKGSSAGNENRATSARDDLASAIRGRWPRCDRSRCSRYRTIASRRRLDVPLSGSTRLVRRPDPFRLPARGWPTTGPGCTTFWDFGPSRGIVCHSLRKR